MMNEFKTYHPLVNFVFFAFVIVLSMFFLHPLCLVFSLIGALSYAIVSGVGKRVNLLYIIPIALFTAISNPLFNHRGATIITYFKNGNPLTAESIYFGIAAALMLCVVILWFACFNSVMTFDKIVYLFGRIVPSLSLVISITLRFIPRLGAHFKEIRMTQKSMGAENRTAWQKLHNLISALSSMVTWSLENAAETADSMTSRGYGIKRRSAFSVYTFSKRDIYTLLITLILGIYITVGIWSGGIKFRYFPTVGGAKIGAYAISVFAAYFILCMLPVIIEVLEVCRWNAIKSKI